MPTAEQVGADSEGTANKMVSQHNVAKDSHNDIRLELEDINKRLTAFFNSDDKTLDELVEIVEYITNNKELIDSITDNKVNVKDIIDNLTSNITDKPLSAAQGVVLKQLIDTLELSLSNYQRKGDYALRSELPTIPTKISVFDNDAGYLTTHQDISGKANVNEVAIYITPEQFGAVGDGINDDSEFIQKALDSADKEVTIYLGTKNYLIESSLLLTGSYKTLICDGRITYKGNDAAIIVKNAYRCKVEISTIDAPNGTAFKMDASGIEGEEGIGPVYCNDFTINTIRNSLIGFHLYTNYTQISHNTIRNNYLKASDTGVKVWADNGTNAYINENLWYMDWIAGDWNYGIYLHSDPALNNIGGYGVNDNKFYSGSLEGQNKSSVPLMIEQSWGNYFKDLRLAEGYGDTSIKLKGKCTRNDIGVNHLTLSEVDITEIGSGSVHNVLRCRGTNSDTTNYFIVGDEIRVTAAHGFTYFPDRYNYNVNIKKDTYQDNIIKHIGTVIPTAVTFRDEEINNGIFIVDGIYSDHGSMARGFPLSVRFGSENGRVLLKDNKNNDIIDNRNGEFDDKTVSIKWNGFHNGLNKNIWEIQELEKPSTSIDVTNLSQNIGFSSRDFGMVLESESGSEYKMVVKDNGLLTTILNKQKNLIPSSTDEADVQYGSADNPGYINGYRIDSKGQPKEITGFGSVTGFIQVAPGAEINFYGADYSKPNATNAVAYYDIDHNMLGVFTGQPVYYPEVGSVCTPENSVITNLDDGGYMLVVPSDPRIYYMRMSMHGYEEHPANNMAIYIMTNVGKMTPIVESINGKTGNVTITAETLGTTSFVTPQMYGAPANGVDDDTEYFEAALSEHDSLYLPDGTYVISRPLSITYKKSIYSNEGQKATIRYTGTGSVINLGRMSVLRNISIVIVNAIEGNVLNTLNTIIPTGEGGLNTRVEHINVDFETYSPKASLIGITVDSGTDPNNMPRLKGLCFQSYKNIHVDNSSEAYGYGIKMELIQGRAFTEETKLGFPWITHIEYSDISLAHPHTAIKAFVNNTSGTEYFERVSMGHILFDNVYTQCLSTIEGEEEAALTRYFLDVEHFGAYMTKCIGWDYHHIGWAGLKTNIIGRGVSISLNDCEMSFGGEFLKTCEFTDETEFTVAKNPEYFMKKYFNGTLLREGYDSVDAKIDSKMSGEFIADIAEEKINDVLYGSYSNILDDPKTQVLVGRRWSSSNKAWVDSSGDTIVLIPLVPGGNIIRWSPTKYELSNSHAYMYFFADDTLEPGIDGGSWIGKGVDANGGRIDIENPSGYKYLALPFNYYTDISSETMLITINREITSSSGQSYIEYLRENAIDPAINQALDSYIQKTDVEEWTFVLEDGTTITKKVVLG